MAQTRLTARFGNKSSAERSLTKIADDRLANAFEKGFGLDSNLIDSREAPTKAAVLCERPQGKHAVYSEERYFDDRGLVDES